MITNRTRECLFLPQFNTMTPNKKLVSVKNGGRSQAYADILTKIQEDAVCPFCPEYLEKYHKPPIVKRGKHWLITPNMYPYENTSFHFLFITTRHITDSEELTREEWLELQELNQWIISEYGIDCGTLIMRSGDMSKTGATVMHLHAQFVVGSDPEKPVMTRVG